jgi:hypothetical protein
MTQNLISIFRVLYNSKQNQRIKIDFLSVSIEMQIAFFLIFWGESESCFMPVRGLGCVTLGLLRSFNDI